MDIIHEPTKDFNFNNLLLSPPLSISSGNHLIKFSCNGSPLYIQSPKCTIKPGVVKAGKRTFCDLTFSIDNEELTQWLENLENHSQKCIFEKRQQWFETNLDEQEIENSFFSPIKLIKSGKCYTLRANIPMILGKPSLKIYDESEQLLNLADLKDDVKAISILELQGIKCSPRGFQIEIEIKQLLIFNPDDIFQKCILHTKTSANTIPLQKSGTLTEKSTNLFTSLNILNDTSTTLPSQMLKDDVIVEEDILHDETQCESDLRMNVCDKVTLPEPEPEPNSDSVLIDSSTIINENDSEQKIDESISEKNTNLTEIDFNLEEIPQEESLVLKKRNDVYYEMYRDALSKAKIAKEMALSNYLEAKRIKNIYMLDDLSDDESDNENEFWSGPEGSNI